MFSFVRSALGSHALLVMVLSSITLAFTASLLWGITPLDLLGSVSDSLTLPEVANFLRAIDVDILGGFAPVPLGVATIVVIAWCVDAVRDGEVRPNRAPSRRGSFVMLALVLASPDVTSLLSLFAAACGFPALAALVARYGLQVALEVLGLRLVDLLVSMFALVVYPLSWLVEQR